MILIALFEWQAGPAQENKRLRLYAFSIRCAAARQMVHREICSARTCPGFESGDLSAHSKTRV